MKAMKVADAEGRYIGIRINCPGCGNKHVLPTDATPFGETPSPHYVGRARWHFNGDFDKPSLSPSVHVRSGHYAYDQTEKGDCYCTYYEEHPQEEQHYSCYVCHFFLREGVIEFLGDCTHALAGKTVELAELDLTCP